MAGYGPGLTGFETCLEDIAWVETQVGNPLPNRTWFPAGGTFGAYRAAEKWAADQGYAKGSMERDAPIGLAAGVDYISKWSNLGPDRLRLDGVMLSADFREGGVMVCLQAKA